MLKDIFLIRHGQSTFNAHYELHGTDPMHVDARLTELGHRQVTQAREALAGITFDVVISSPLTRAIETALGIFGDADVPFEITCRHRERLESSCDVGRSPSHLARDFPKLAFDHLQDPWWHVGETDERGFATEPLDVFEQRVANFAEWLMARPERTIAVIGHGTFFRQLTGCWMANCEVMQWHPSGVEAALRRA